MRFKRHIKLEQGLRQIDIAPLIDIMFQLIIFFMLTSNFIADQGIRVNLPRADSGERVRQEDRVAILISAEGVVYSDDRVYTLKGLRSYLRELKDRAVFIRADRRVSLGRVVEVWDLCRELGISKISIATTDD